MKQKKVSSFIIWHISVTRMDFFPEHKIILKCVSVIRRRRRHLNFISSFQSRPYLIKFSLTLNQNLPRKERVEFLVPARPTNGFRSRF